MPIVAFNFDKINVEKIKNISRSIKVANDVDISEVKEENLKIEGSKNAAARFVFKFRTRYEPKVGNINLEGHIIYLEDSKKIKDVLKSWKDNKKIEKDLMTYLINAILIRCNIKALTLSQEVSLPPHIQLPMISPKKQPKDYIG